MMPSAEVEPKRKSFFSFNRLTTLIGGMSFFASVFELLNVGRFLELFVVSIHFAADVVFGFEILAILSIALLFEKLLHRFTKRKEGKI